MSEKLEALLGKPEDTLYLVDVSSFIFRAYFAIRNLKNKEGQPTNAIYGVATMLARLIEEARVQNLAIIYDSKEPSFRKEIYTEYKANRSAPPDDLVPQFPWIEELIRCMGICSFRKSGVEADDLIGVVTKKWCALDSSKRVVVVTGDKDLMQLVDEHVRVWDTMANKIYSSKEVEEKFGVKPFQIRDYLALVGDSSDNIPGVAGVGPKTAADLLKEFGDVESVLSAAKEGKIGGKKAQVLVDHVEDARLSVRLASLAFDLDFDFDPDSVKFSFELRDECVDLLRRLDFHTLLAKWAKTLPESELKAETVNAGVKLSADCFRTISTESQFSELLSAIEKRGEFALDLETTSLNPRNAEIVGVALSWDSAFGCYIPVGHRGLSSAQLSKSLVLEKLKPILENPKIKKIGQNLKYDFSVLCAHNINVDGIGADTMVASYVLEPEGRHNIETLAQKYLNYSVLSYESVCGKNGSSQIGFDEVDIALATRYSAEDALVALRLWEVFLPKLQQEGLMEVFARVDLPLVPVLARMECCGVRIDEKWLDKLSFQFKQELNQIEQRIRVFTKGEINLNSSKQLAKLLFDDLGLPVQAKTKTGFSTDAFTLEVLAPLHEVPRLLLEYREISKLKNTYVDPLPQMVDAKTKKIHASFHQTVTATGRLSSSDPNLQNIPIRTDRGKLIRKAFIPSDGNVLISADYSQIELRLLAFMSKDQDLLKSFRNDEDVHKRTASELFSVSPEAVTDRERGIAKAINFGLMYGKTAFGLAQELKITRREAQDIITRYFERYRGIKEFLDNQVSEARRRKFTTTLLGRKRYLSDIDAKNPAIRANAERMAMNAPIQGTAADLMKLAMTKIDDELMTRGFKAKLIIQVHDEVVIDCPRDEVDQVSKLVVDTMEHALDEMVRIDIPLKVNQFSGDNWMDL